MYDIGDMLNDEHLQATGFIRHVEHPTEGEVLDLAIPTEWSKSTPEYRLPTPNLGEHTAEILREIGYADADIDRFEMAGAVARHTVV